MEKIELLLEDKGHPFKYPHFDYLLRLPYSHKDKLPSIPAVYFVYAPNVVLYIGMTVTLHGRFKGHSHSSIFKKAKNQLWVAWLPTPHAHLYKLERLLIKTIKPVYNRNHDDQPVYLSDRALKRLLKSRAA